MKARKIHENLDFERGKDPKRTLDIGLNPIEIVYAESYIGNRSVPFSRSSRSIISVLKNWSNNDDLYNWQFWDKDHHTYLSSDLEGKTVRYLGKIYKLGNIYESANFERGKTPKEALSIGVETQYQKIIDRVSEENTKNNYFKPVHKGIFKGVPYIIFQDTIVGSNESWGKDPFIGTFIRNDTIEDSRWTSTIGKAIKSIRKRIDEE